MIGIDIKTEIININIGVYAKVSAEVVGDKESIKLELQRYLKRRLHKWKYAEGVIWSSRRLSSFDNYKELKEWVEDRQEEVEIEFKNFRDLLENAERVEVERIIYKD